MEAKSKKYSIKITLNHPDLQDKFQDHLPLYPDLDNTRGKVNIVIFSGKFRANILQLDPKISDSLPPFRALCRTSCQKSGDI